MASSKLRIAIGVILFLLIGGFGIYFFFTKVRLVDKNNLFELYISGKYSLEENDYGSDDTPPLSMFDERKQVYITGYTYEIPEKEFKKIVLEDMDAVVKQGAELTSKTKDFKLKSTESYYYSITYKDKKDIEYFRVSHFIKTKKGFYLLDFVCLKQDKSKYEKDFNKIAKTFKELG